jgi:hypothetical protein
VEASIPRRLREVHEGGKHLKKGGLASAQKERKERAVGLSLEERKKKESGRVTGDGESKCEGTGQRQEG